MGTFFYRYFIISLLPVSLCGLPVVTGTASANTSATTSTVLNSNFGSPAYLSDNDQQNYPGNTLSAVQSALVNGLAGYYTNHTSTHGSAQAGVIRLFSTADSVATDPGAPSYVTAHASGTATASWSDSFTIDGGTLNGQTGQLVAGFLVDGTLSGAFDNSVTFSALMDVQYRASLRLYNSGAGSDVTERGGQRHSVSYQGDVWGQSFGFPIRAPGLWTITTNFKFGTPISVESWADMTSYATAFSTDLYPVSSISAIVNFPTIGWNGITAVTDSLGNPVTNYTVSSVSGFDYQSPAPPHQCIVNLEDFASLARQWLQTGCDQTNDWCGGADLDLGNVVDLNDLSTLANYWLDTCPPDWPWQ